MVNEGSRNEAGDEEATVRSGSVIARSRRIWGAKSMGHYISVEDRRFLRVEEAGHRLKRIAALKKGLTRSLAGWLPRLPDFTGKCHLARHLYLDARGAQAAATRVWELRFGRSEFAAPAELEPFLTIMDRAADVPEMLAGLYLTVKAEMVAAYRQ